MKKGVITLFILLFGSTCLFAQQHYKLDNEMVGFFLGSWSGEGEFANGNKIAADLTFKLMLDSCWLTCEHTDKLPNKYKAISFWGVDPVNGQFMAYAFDNFNGNRKFLSDGWKGNKLVLTISEVYPKVGLLFQHFIYEKLSDKSFKMTYETSKDGITWKLGDYLVFNKK